MHPQITSNLRRFLHGAVKAHASAHDLTGTIRETVNELADFRQQRPFPLLLLAIVRAGPGHDAATSRAVIVLVRTRRHSASSSRTFTIANPVNIFGGGLSGASLNCGRSREMP
jgi:hypothetical protein